MRSWELVQGAPQLLPKAAGRGDSIFYRWTDNRILKSPIFLSHKVSLDWGRRPENPEKTLGKRTCKLHREQLLRTWKVLAVRQARGEIHSLDLVVNVHVENLARLAFLQTKTILYDMFHSFTESCIKVHPPSNICAAFKCDFTWRENIKPTISRYHRVLSNLSRDFWKHFLQSVKHELGLISTCSRKGWCR